jgi:hypothetical protein
MDQLLVPVKTSFGRQSLQRRDCTIDRIQRALLASDDGHRNVIELESFARALGLAPEALEQLRRQGLIDMYAYSSPSDSPLRSLASSQGSGCPH